MIQDSAITSIHSNISSLDNTSDLLKPITIVVEQTQTALDLKANTSSLNTTYINVGFNSIQTALIFPNTITRTKCGKKYQHYQSIIIIAFIPSQIFILVTSLHQSTTLGSQHVLKLASI